MRITFFIGLAGLLMWSSCAKEDPQPTPAVDAQPKTYSFDNVDYSGQLARLDMLEELTAEMKKPASGEVISSTQLLDMFANSNSPFSAAELNSSGKQLKDKCYSGGGGIPDVDFFEYYLTRLATLSGSSTAWSPGVAGISTSGTKSYFIDENGVEYAQLVEKGLMGAVFYYQIAENYTREGKIGSGVDNTTVETGKGTPMEHHWDEAFGYFGAPKDLSEENYSDLSLRFHAKYAAVGSNAGLGTIGKVMSQFIRGRHSISKKKYTDRDEAADQLRREYELVLVTSAIHYINGAIDNIADDAVRNHELSEAFAFILSLHYNRDKRITDAQLETVKSYFMMDVGGQMVPGFLQITISDLQQAKNTLSTVYGLDAVKDQL
jgi:hypothetical protein